MRLIGIMGPAGAGKSTIGKLLTDKHGFTRFSMADPLKAGLRGMGIPAEWETDRSQRDDAQEMLCGKSWREAAQTIGTEWGRKKIGEDLWVNLMEHKLYYHEAALERAGKSLCAVIDDIRFPNEVEMIHSMGGEIWLVTGREHEVKLPLWTRIKHFFFIGRPHVSERHWRRVTPDIRIHNDFSMPTLVAQVEINLEGYDRAA